MRETINGAAFQDMIINAAAAIEINKQQINELNVFPVPDGDTGTNMSLTMAAAAAELKKSNNTLVGKAAEIAAGALLRGARGNSGVILSLLFRGLARSLKDKSEASGAEFAEALSEGVEAAYKAVMKPAEGTILTVSKVIAKSAGAISETEQDVELVLEHSIKNGYVALAETINQNPVLKKAGVIDAGGKGYLIILEGMLKALRGDFVNIPIVGNGDGELREKAVFSDFDTEDITFYYCTEFIVGRENQKDPGLLWEFLGELGDSAVVVDDDEIIKVHVHTNEPGVVITEALSYGSLLSVKIENMREQHTETIAREAQDPDGGRRIAKPEKQYGVVSVCAGAGMEEIFRDLGVDGIITGGQTMNPCTEEILNEIDRTPSEIVYVLPNNKNIIMAAQQCVGLSEKKVIVIPTGTVAQGVSAMLSMDTIGEEDDCTQSLMDAISRVHTAQITYAARDSEFDEQTIKAGEYLALLENSLLCSSTDFNTLLARIIEEMQAFSPAFITIFYGEDVDEAAAEACRDAVVAQFSDCEINLIFGGQPVYYYMISAE